MCRAFEDYWKRQASIKQTVDPTENRATKRSRRLPHD